MNEFERDKGYVPPYTSLMVETMVDNDEPMLFAALTKIAHHAQFSRMSNSAKARCAFHLGSMLSSTPDDDGIRRE